MTSRAPSLLPFAMYRSTRSRCRSDTSGPISVAGSSASPTGSEDANPASVSTTSPYRDRGARIRVPA